MKEIDTSATETSAPPAFHEHGRSRVSVATCPSYSPADVGTALTEAVESLGGLSAFVKAGQTVLIKPNLFSAHPPEHAVTTHPELVRHVISACVQAGAARVGEASAVNVEATGSRAHYIDGESEPYNGGTRHARCGVEFKIK